MKCPPVSPSHSRTTRRTSDAHTAIYAKGATRSTRFFASRALRIGLRRGPPSRFAFFESGSYRSAARFRPVAAEFRCKFLMHSSSRGAMSIRGRVLIASKVAATAGLLWFALGRIDWAVVGLRLNAVVPLFGGAALIVLALQIVPTALRWR